MFQKILWNRTYIPLVTLEVHQQRLSVASELQKHLRKQGIKGVWTCRHQGEPNSIRITFMVKRMQLTRALRLLREFILKNTLNDELEFFEEKSPRRALKVIDTVLRKPYVDDSLCFFIPTEVRKGMETNSTLQEWYSFLDKYDPPSSPIYLLTPCTGIKPFSRSLVQKAIQDLFHRLNIIPYVEIFVISEPLAIVPREIFEVMPMYECPGLFRWFCAQENLPFDQEDYDAAIEHLGSRIATFLKRCSVKYDHILAYIRQGSTHHQMLLIAEEKLGHEIPIVPSLVEYEKLRKKLSKTEFAYRLMSNPETVQHLEKMLLECLAITR